MTRPNRMMVVNINIPFEWICNVKESAVDALTIGDDRLCVGRPQPTQAFTVKELEAKGYVGLYVKKPDFYIPCSACHVGIPVSDPTHVTSIRSGEFVILHFDCLPEEQREGALVTPYALMKVPAVKGGEDEGDPADARGNGAGQ